MLVVIGGGGKTLRLSTRRTRHHHGNLTIQIESLFDDARLMAEEKPGVGGGRLVAEIGPAKADADLTAAVVSALGAFDEAAATKRRDSFGEIMLRSRRVPGSERKSMLAEPFFLANAVLDNVQQLGRWPDRRILRGGFKARDRNLFNF